MIICQKRLKSRGKKVEIKLLKDVEYNDYKIEIDYGGTYTLDLNNHIISVKTIFPGFSFMCIKNGCLVLQDSGDKDRGCVQANGYNCVVRIEENGSFKFYSGMIDGDADEVVNGISVWGGKAEITGKSYIRSNNRGISFSSGELFISGEAEIYGEDTGVYGSHGGAKVIGTIIIDENPYIWRSVRVKG